MGIYNVIVLILNLLGGTIILGLDEGVTFGLSILYCTLFIPLSYICWFRPAYNAFRNNSLINFILFFITFTCQICFSVLMSLGIPNTGSSGIIIALIAFKKRKTNSGDYFIGGIILIITLGFALGALAQVLLLLKVHRLYRMRNENEKDESSKNEGNDADIDNESSI